METSPSRHLSVVVAAPAHVAYAYAADPERLPEWAAGLAAGVEQVDGAWYADSPMGRVRVDLAPANDLGVLDHVVTMPDGERVLNPVRVLPWGEGCEVVFTVRRRAGVDDAEFEADCAAVAADLEALRDRLERRD
ncbi:SRPBCC family protein [Vallicoccus soli]|uniref:SRPBCC family protein n=1 Tax=Vallicoccus soli TaxID=2339232 RepID=A0A3A3Z0S4_9ACTN|nr:SRPBCC family protein [Vallicoccus soli]RJK96006.1 SRPBCC family protein [Vallicoccus soli]